MRKPVLLFWFCLLKNVCIQAQTLMPAILPEARPYTRWWWLGSDVDSANLNYNLTALAQAGIGGVEITPIYGVKNREAHYINYLSPKWMQMLATTQGIARELGIQVDMNSGTGWPFGGPDISIEDAATKAIWQEYFVKKGSRLQEAIMVKEEKQNGIAKLSRVMAYAVDSNGINNDRRKVLDLTKKVIENGILDWTAPQDADYKLISLYVGKTLQKVLRAAPGGQGYVLDHLNKAAVKRYLAKFDSAFAKSATPYPNTFFNDSYEVIRADWTTDLLTEFEKRRGYRLEEYFPELLAKGATDLSTRVISDYRETIGELLQQNFAETWTSWAHSHNARTRNQAHGSPANLLDLYAATDIPEYEQFGRTEFDINGLRKDEIQKLNDGVRTAMKFASSAAHVTGKPLTSCESFTWMTEHFRTSLSQMKPEIDQIFTSGVNHVYFHGTAYSPKDAAWPGWQFYAAVDVSPKDPMWRNAPAFFSYISRVQSFLQDGLPDSDFLLYLPVYDMYDKMKDSYYMTFIVDGLKKQLPDFFNVVDEIRNAGYDMDYISDKFIRSLAVTPGGLLRTANGTAYKALILPAVNKMPVATWKHIRSLTEQGATVVVARHFPSEVPGMEGLKQKPFKFFQSSISGLNMVSFDRTRNSLVKQGRFITGSSYIDMLSLCTKKESFNAAFGGQMIRRKHRDGYHYFFTMLQNRFVDGWVPIAVKAESAMLYNPMTDQKGKARIRQNRGKTEIFLQLKSGESIILKTFTNKNIELADWVYYEDTKNIFNLNKDWTMEFIESEPQVKSKFHLNELMSWTSIGNDTLTKNMGTARYTKQFSLEKKEHAEYRLILGDVRESARVWVNGKEAGVVYAAPFEINVGKYLRAGDNLLEIDVTNLPANRIADYDRRGLEWRIFNDINFVDLTYIKGKKYDGWQILSSGLLGEVKIQELKLK